MFKSAILDKGGEPWGPSSLDKNYVECWKELLVHNN